MNPYSQSHKENEIKWTLTKLTWKSLQSIMLIYINANSGKSLKHNFKKEHKICEKQTLHLK